MKTNDFKAALKINVPKIVDSNINQIDKSNLLLIKLGLFPLPNNVQAYISSDNKKSIMFLWIIPFCEKFSLSIDKTYFG